MSWNVQGFPNTAGGFTWRTFSTYDLRDDVHFEVHVLTPDEFVSEDEALMYMSHEVWSKEVPWVDPFPHGSWNFDFDSLRTSVDGADALPAWLNGKRRGEPIISRSYAFDMEGVPATDKAPTALFATNVDSARAAGHNVMLSHVASFTFYKIDPFAELEKALSERAQPIEIGKPMVPTEVVDSLARFRADHKSRPTAFLMMRFGKTQAHARIVDSIAAALDGAGVTVVRADEREYHSDLFFNILTYIYACDFGIAVFERLEGNEFNPNVSLEVGYMLGIGKQVCLLKDQTLKSLHTDLVGKLYRDFDPQDPAGSIPSKLMAWLRDWKDTIGIRLDTE